MKFTAKFLQPKTSANLIHRETESSTGDSPFLQRIYDVYRRPDGRIEGEDEDITKALERRDAVTGRLGEEGNFGFSRNE